MLVEFVNDNLFIFLWWKIVFFDLDFLLVKILIIFLGRIFWKILVSLINDKGVDDDGWIIIVLFVVKVGFNFYEVNKIGKFYVIIVLIILIGLLIIKFIVFWLILLIEFLLVVKILVKYLNWLVVCGILIVDVLW